MDTTSSAETMQAAALELAGLGFEVLPIVRGAKHPRKDPDLELVHGLKDATRDPERIRQIWRKHPTDNIGAVLHDELVVLDIDDHTDADGGGVDGNEKRREWEREHGDLPETVTSITGGGGTHLIYRTDRPINDVHGCAATGIDVLTGDHYIVLPPSIHKSGKPYAWEIAPDEVPIAPVDDQVIAFIEYIMQKVKDARGTGGGKGKRGRKTGSTAAAERFELPAVIYKGSRNDTLTSLAGSLWAKGESIENIRRDVHIANVTLCRPDPLKPEEEASIVDSITTNYPPGHSPEFDARMRGEAE